MYDNEACKLKVKRYVRYCDDFVIVDTDAVKLGLYIDKIDTFLKNKLNLNLHPKKVNIRKCSQGVDFLGYILMPHYTLVRTNTRKRIIKKIATLCAVEDKSRLLKALPSYIGILDHAHGNKLKDKIIDIIEPVFKEDVKRCRELSHFLLSIKDDLK